MPINEESAASPRFVAYPPARGTGLTIQGMSKFGLGLAAAGLASIAPWVLYSAMPASFRSNPGTAIVFGLSYGVLLVLLLGFLAFRWRRRRKILIGVTSDGVTVNQRPGDVYSFPDAKLGLWGPGSLTVGTALHLHCGPHSFVVGGRDHRLATGVQLDAPPVDCPDAWMSATDFGELLTVVGGRSRLDIREPAPGEPIRCLLFPGEAMQAAVSWAFGEKLPFSSPPKPRLAIDASDDEIRVIDPNTNALKASAPPARVTATPKTYVTPLVRTSPWTVPALVMDVPGLQSLIIGCQEGMPGALRFPWQDGVQQVDQPGWSYRDFGASVKLFPPGTYLVTGRDWLTLVEKCGLASYLERDE